MKRVDIPDGRLASAELRRGVLTLTVMEGTLAGRMHTVRVKIIDTDAQVMEDLRRAARGIADAVTERLMQLEEADCQGLLDLPGTQP